MYLDTGMTSIALSPNRRYVAIGEKGEKPTVTIYDLLHDQSKKRKVSGIILFHHSSSCAVIYVQYNYNILW